MEYLYTKITIISLFTSLLLILFINTTFYNLLKKYSKKIRILLNLLIYLILFFILLISNYFISSLGMTSILFFNTSILTIIFFELAIFLEKSFWDDFLGNSLPRSINLLISFVVMMNFGYFTLMFYIKVLGVSYFIS
tara:strand:- start:2317 stop:2727 length:411 start_codon:yes stop_codon:yes gene_type:complete